LASLARFLKKVWHFRRKSYSPQKDLFCGVYIPMKDGNCLIITLVVARPGSIFTASISTEYAFLRASHRPELKAVQVYLKHPAPVGLCITFSVETSSHIDT
jgi:hypothetical protein